MELQDLLNVALKIESTGFENYSKLAKRSSGEISTFFQEMAEQEKTHMEIFQDLFKGITKDTKGTWVDEENAGYLMAFAQTSIFPKLEAALPQDLQTAIKSAIDVEKDSILFYNDLQTFFPDKEALQKIIDEEKRHMMDLLKRA